MKTDSSQYDPELSGKFDRRHVIGGLGASLLAANSMTARARALHAPVRQQIGINYYDLFMPYLDGTNTEDSARQLAELGRMGVPFVRFPASAQQAGKWGLLRSEPQKYWDNMDRIFLAAEKSGIKLVPVVLWNAVSIAYHVGDPMQAWGDPQSRTRTFAQDYAEQFVSRYHRSSAILMWECCNELNYWADLKTQSTYWPRPDPTVPDRKKLPTDMIDSGLVKSLYRMFGDTVRKYDTRLISTGGDIPRFNAFSLANNKEGNDTIDQFRENLRMVTPDPCDVMSIHLYPGKWGQPTSIFPTVSTLIDSVKQAAAASGKKAFIGEFGVPSGPVPQAERPAFETLFQAIQASDVEYAAVWVYGRTVQDKMNVTATNDRSYQLDMIIKANRG
jgi:endo-1,4-beta-mannosidase